MTGNGFSSLDSSFMEAMRSYAEQQRRIVEYFGRVRAPVLNVSTLWEEENRRWREFEEMARRWSAPMVVPGLESAMAAAKAFSALAAPSLVGQSVLEMGARSMAEAQRLYNQVAAASLITSRIGQSIAEAARAASWISTFDGPLSSLRKAGSEVYEAFARQPAPLALATDWTLQAPGILPYTASMSVAVLGSAELPNLSERNDLDATVDDAGKSIERRLRAVSPALLRPYRGAIAVLEVGGPDWSRHFGVSVRTLVDALIVELAPDDLVEAYLPDPASHKEDGRFTRRARLTYIFREVAYGEYARMAEKNIDMILATFFLAQKAVHELLPALDVKQARVFVRQIQGCLLVILETVSD
jgi:hypothetical protein